MRQDKDIYDILNIILNRNAANTIRLTEENASTQKMLTAIIQLLKQKHRDDQALSRERRR